MSQTTTPMNDADRRTQMQRIIDCQLEVIERNLNRPQWHDPAMAFGAIVASMAVIASAMWFVKYVL
jgi:hypothetical protein